MASGEPTCLICDYGISVHTSPDELPPGCEGWAHPLWNVDGTPKPPDKNMVDGPNVFEDLAVRTSDTYVAASEDVADDDPGWVNTAFLRRERAKALANAIPTVGDIVHYWDDRCIAAIVTDTGVTGDEPDLLTTFSPQATYPIPVECRHDEDRIAGTWHWPEPA